MSGRSSERPQRPRFHKAYSFGLVTGAFFLLSWLGQFCSKWWWYATRRSSTARRLPGRIFCPSSSLRRSRTGQSEFLQLVWQAAGLALFYFWGSSQSKESDDRLEAKIDALLRDRNIDPIQFEYEEEDKLGGPAKNGGSQQSDGQRHEKAHST
jgi:hypothetical protein